jgi:hypothetical protein
MSAALNISGLVSLTRKLKRQAAKVFVTVNAVEKRRNKEVKKCSTECVNGSTALCSLSESFS